MVFGSQGWECWSFSTFRKSLLLGSSPLPPPSSKRYNCCTGPQISATPGCKECGQWSSQFSEFSDQFKGISHLDPGDHVGSPLSLCRPHNLPLFKTRLAHYLYLYLSPCFFLVAVGVSPEKRSSSPPSGLPQSLLPGSTRKGALLR